MKKYFLLFSISISLFLFATTCNKTKNSKDISITSAAQDSAALAEAEWKNAPSLDPPQPLNEKLAALADSVKVSWKTLNEVDNKKFEHIALIIKEFNKIKPINQSLLDSVRMLHTKAVQVHYNEQNLQDSKVVDEYDATIELLMEKIDRLETTSKYLDKCRACMETFEAIRQADSKDLIQRIRYTSFAQELNVLLETEKAAIEKLDEKYRQIKPATLFAK
jgi:hypothetical protein